MDKEFETEATLNAFRDLFKKAYPTGCSNRQKADLMSFFFAGHITGCTQYVNALNELRTKEGAMALMDNMVEDSTCRGLYAASCMITNKFTDPMFND